MTINSIGDLRDAFEQVIDNLKRDYPSLVVGYANDITALIEERITQFGLDSDGVKFKDYTDRYKRFKQNPGRYAAGRALGLGSSRYTGKVDYSLTGELWGDVQVIDTSSVSGKVVVTVSAKKAINQKKLEGLKNREIDKHDPLQPSEDEIERAKENFEAGLLELFAPLL